MRSWPSFSMVVALALALCGPKLDAQGPPPSHSSPYYWVTDSPYNAYGDGTHDDSGAIQSAITQASLDYQADPNPAKQPYTVYLPPNTYLLESFQAGNILLLPKSGVNILGAGNSSILRVAGGLNSGTSSFVVFQSGNSSNLLNVTFSYFLFDCNGANNLSTGIQSDGDQCIYVSKGDSITIDHVTIQDNPGRQCLHFGHNTNPQDVTHLTISNCYFHNLGSVIEGNEIQNDHSAIYAQADYCSIHDNSFQNDSTHPDTTPVVVNYTTAIECHSSDADVYSNTITNFNQAFNIAATYNDQVNSSYHDNVVNGCWSRVVCVWINPGLTMSGITFTNNQLEQARPTPTAASGWAGVGQSFAMIDLNSDVLSSIHDFTISYNTFTNTTASNAYTDASSNPAIWIPGAGVEVGNVLTCTIDHNQFGGTTHGLLGSAVVSGVCAFDNTTHAFDTAIPANTNTLVISNNTVTDCGQGSGGPAAYHGIAACDYHSAFGFYGSQALASLTMTGNTVTNSSTPYMDWGILGSAPLNTWAESSNSFSGLPTDSRAGSDQELSWMTSVPAATAVNEGSTASFDVEVPSVLSPSYQWYSGNGSSWTSISGATNNSYTTPTLAVADNGTEYYVKVNITPSNISPSTSSSHVWASVPVTLTVHDITPPTAPTPTVSQLHGTITFSDSATDSGSGMAQVAFYLDGSVYSRDYSAPFSAGWNSVGHDGSHTIYVYTFDNAGNSAASSSYTFTVDNVPPTVSASESGVHNTVTLNSSPSDDRAVDHVDFYVDGSVVGTLSSSPWNLSWNSVGHDGSHSYYAVAYDAAGNSGTSSTVSFSTDSTAPSVSASVSGSSGVVTFSATATDNVGVTQVNFYLDGVTYGHVTSSPYNMGWNSTGHAGSHTLLVTAQDADGNYGTTSTINFTTY